MIVDNRHLTDQDRLRLMRTIEEECDMDAVSTLPYAKVREYPPEVLTLDGHHD